MIWAKLLNSKENEKKIIYFWVKDKTIKKTAVIVCPGAVYIAVGLEHAIRRIFGGQESAWNTKNTGKENLLPFNSFNLYWLEFGWFAPILLFM